MPEIEIKNAIIRSAHFDTERGLSAWINLDYGGSGQGFGGWMLGGKKGWEKEANYAGRFISRVLEVADVDDWGKLPGKTIRVKADWNKVHAIGHIVKDDWFNPAEEFGSVRSAAV